ncbi:MAG: hypothetical protein HZA95_00645 [Candidatus Vogelbacteria bacterium]|nr:hypothetical protein [Candidatus Vogelbacteria bacterium]
MSRSKKAESKPEAKAVAGVNPCPCGCGKWARVICANYPDGLYIESKMQGITMMSSLNRINGASEDELKAIDNGLSGVNLRDNSAGDEQLRAQSLVYPKSVIMSASARSVKLANAEAEMIKFQQLDDIVPPTFNADEVRAAERELKARVAREPEATVFSCSETREKVVVIEGRDWTRIVGFVHGPTLEAVRGLVESDVFRSDDFDQIATVITEAKLPLGRRVKEVPMISIFKAKSGRTFIRFRIGGFYGEKYIEYEPEAIDLLDDAIKKNLVSVGNYDELKAKIESAKLMPGGEEVNEAVSVGKFTGIICRRGDSVVETYITQDATFVLGLDGIRVVSGLPKGLESVLRHLLDDPSNP